MSVDKCSSHYISLKCFLKEVDKLRKYFYSSIPLFFSIIIIIINAIRWSTNDLNATGVNQKPVCIIGNVSYKNFTVRYWRE